MDHDLLQLKLYKDEANHCMEFIAGKLMAAR